MIILGLDIGEKTVGVAASDALGITAQPITTIHYKVLKDAFFKIKAILTEREANKIVAGLPLNMNGDEGPQAEKVRNFMEDLSQFLTKQHINCTIEYWDERLTTMESERLLIEADVGRSKRKKVIDKMAASLILQGYLEVHR